VVSVAVKVYYLVPGAKFGKIARVEWRPIVKAQLTHYIVFTAGLDQENTWLPIDLFLTSSMARLANSLHNQESRI